MFPRCLGVARSSRRPWWLYVGTTKGLSGFAIPDYAPLRCPATHVSYGYLSVLDWPFVCRAATWAMRCCAVSSRPSTASRPAETALRGQLDQVPLASRPRGMLTGCKAFKPM
jgi:hypothetical protein